MQMVSDFVLRGTLFANQYSTIWLLVVFSRLCHCHGTLRIPWTFCLWYSRDWKDCSWGNCSGRSWKSCCLVSITIGWFTVDCWFCCTTTWASESSNKSFSFLFYLTRTHTQVRELAIRREMEKAILARKLQETADDWATPVESLSPIVRKHAEQ